MLLNNNSKTLLGTKIILTTVMMSLLVSCGGSGVQKSDRNKLKGERISVLTFEQSLTANSEIKDLEVTIPAPVVNKNWAQPGGNNSHVMHHLKIADDPKEIWSYDLGQGSDGRASLISMPVVSDGVLYATDALSTITALNADTGKKIWQIEITEEGQTNNTAYGGGITIGGNNVFVVNGYGHFIALDKTTGAEKWRFQAGVAFRGAPSYADGKVFAITLDNQTYAFDANDGRLIWSEVGTAEVIGLVGSASPAVIGNTVISAYSSGEIYAMLVDNGRILWSDTLNRKGRLTAMATLRDVDGFPVVYDGKVYAASHSGRMVSVDLRSGGRIWEQNVGSLHTPWVAGEFIYVVTPESEIICLTRRDGKIRWVRQLERYEDEARKEPVFWHGPILVSDRLIVTSSNGYSVAVSPYTGEFLSGIELPDGVDLPPIVANGTVYFLTRDAEIVAYK
jgi:outer membrane protein assembly factor BamB